MVLHKVLNGKGYNFQDRLIKDLWNCLWNTRNSRWTQGRNQGLQEGRTSLEIFHPSLEKCVGLSLKIFSPIQKTHRPPLVSQASYMPGWPQWSTWTTLRITGVIISCHNCTCWL